MKSRVRILLITPLAIGALLFLAACASSPAYHPDMPMPEGDWKARAQSQQANGVEVTAACLLYTSDAADDEYNVVLWGGGGGW